MSITPNAVPQYAGAIVSASDGRILCQLRDDKPGIVCPGRWSCCPGGCLEVGESPIEAVVRELREEFEIEVTGLSGLSTHKEEKGGYRGVYHAFFADLVTPVAEVKCNEGVRSQFFLPQEAVRIAQHPVSLMFLRTYMDRVRV